MTEQFFYGMLTGGFIAAALHYVNMIVLAHKRMLNEKIEAATMHEMMSNLDKIEKVSITKIEKP